MILKYSISDVLKLYREEMELENDSKEEIQVNALTTSDLLKRDAQEFAIFRAAMFYSFALLLLPVLTFFITKSILFDVILTMGSVRSNVCAAACAIVVLHVALAAFLFKAYNSPDEKEEKKE